MFEKMVFLVCLAGCAGVAAQSSVTNSTGVTSSEQMIQQLERKAPPRTRSIRNLTVEAALGSAAAPAPATVASVPASTPTSIPAPTLHEDRPALSLLIEFDYNSTSVRPESQQLLTMLSQALQSEKLHLSHFAVEGHTDAKGRADYNQNLSQRRAMAVRDFLKTQGVVAYRLATVGKGASELANPADPQSGENRRVRIVNLD